MSISPNTGMSLENIIFDPTYYGLTALIIILSLVAAVLSIGVGRNSADQNQRVRATSTGLVALGFAIVFITATSFLALLRAGVIGGFLYQQTQFLAVYVGTALILLGLDRTMTPVVDAGLQSKHASQKTKLRAAVWIAFAASVFVAVIHVFSPSTYAVTVSGGAEHVAQQGVFWLPPFFTIVAGAVGLPLFTVRNNDAMVRRHAIWFGLFFMLVLIGVLRESTLIPSAGDPFADLLVTFIPFTAGGFCLLASALSLRSTGLDEDEIEYALPIHH